MVWMRSSRGSKAPTACPSTTTRTSCVSALRVNNYSCCRKLFPGDLNLMDVHGALFLSNMPQVPYLEHFCSPGMLEKNTTVRVPLSWPLPHNPLLSLLQGSLFVLELEWLP